jgi:hypothetical protein
MQRRLAKESISREKIDENEFEAYECDCAACLLYNRLEEMSGKELRLENRIAWLHEEMSEQRRAFTDSTEAISSV